MAKRLFGTITPNNTTATETEDYISVTLHRTEVFHHDKRAGVVTLRTGGWPTVTTKRRINEAFKAFLPGAFLWQQNHEWFVSYAGQILPFSSDVLTFKVAN